MKRRAKLLSCFLLVLLAVHDSGAASSNEWLNDELSFIHQEINLLRGENQNQNILIARLQERVGLQADDETEMVRRQEKESLPQLISGISFHHPSRQERPARLLPLQLLFNYQKNDTDYTKPIRKFYGPPTNCSDLKQLGYTLNGFYLVNKTEANLFDGDGIGHRIETVFCAFKQEGPFNSSTVENPVGFLKIHSGNTSELREKAANNSSMKDESEKTGTLTAQTNASSILGGIPVGKLNGSYNSSAREKRMDFIKVDENIAKTTFQHGVKSHNSAGFKDNTNNGFGKLLLHIQINKNLPTNIIQRPGEPVQFDNIIINSEKTYDLDALAFFAPVTGTYKFLFEGKVLTMKAENVTFRLSCRFPPDYQTRGKHLTYGVASDLTRNQVMLEATKKLSKSTRIQLKSATDGAYTLSSDNATYFKVYLL